MKNNFSWIIVATLVGVFLLHSCNVQAAQQISFSAQILNSDNKSVINGDYEVSFAIYTTDREKQTDPMGSPIWQETQKVKVFEGLIVAQLGTINPVPAGLNFSEGSFYLGVKLNSDSEAVPRKKFGAVLVALNALNAQSLQGASLGTDSGDILQLGKGGKINLKQLPSITKLGTVSTGVWEGTQVDSNYISDVLDNKTYNGLTLRDNGSAGFSINNNDNSTLNVTASSVTLDQDLSTVSSPTFAGLNLAGATYLAPISAPALTTNRLYNVSNGLYWGDTLIGGATTGVWTSDGTNVWRAGGNVGIGTGSPSEALEVVGNAKISGTLEANSLIISGGASIGTLGLNIAMNSSLVPSTSGLNLGSSSNYWSNIYVDNLSVGGTDLNGTSSSYFAINTDSTSDENMGLRFYRSSLNGYAGLFWNAANQNFNLFKRENTSALADLNVQNLYATGNVGIGTASPSVPLEVQRSDNGIIQRWNNTGGINVGQIETSGTWQVGNINLRESSGSASIHQVLRPDLNYIGLMSDHQMVWRSVNTGSFFSVGSLDTGIGRHSAGVVKITDGTTGDGSLYAGGSSDNYFAGNVGIGTTSPGVQLQIEHPSEAVYDGMGYASLAGYSGLWLGRTTSTGNHQNTTLLANSTQTFLSGNGLLSLTPSQYSDTVLVTVASTGTKIRGGTSDNTAAALNVVNSSGTSAMFVRNDGNVGIGTTTPEEKLHVNGNIQIDGTSAGTYIKLKAGGTNSLSVIGPNGFVGNVIAGSYYTSTYNSDTVLNQYGLTMASGNPIYWRSGPAGSGDTYLSRSSANTLRLSSDGTTGLANLVVNGNVGIGTASPGAKLDINGAMVVQDTSLSSADKSGFIFESIVDLSNSTTSALRIYPKDSSNHRLYWGKSDKKIYTMDFSNVSSGLVFVPNITMSGSSIYMAAGPTISGSAGNPFKVHSFFGLQIEDNSNNQIARFGVSDGNITSYFYGNVGIGTTTPTSRLHGVTILSAATGDEVAYELDYTTNKLTSGNDTGLKINMTDTASPGTSYLIDAQVEGWSKFSVSNGGAIKATGLVETAGIRHHTNNNTFDIGSWRNFDNTDTAISMLLSANMTQGTGESFIGVGITPTYNQTSTAAATDLLINRTETTVGSGAQYLIDAQVGGTNKFSVTNTGQGYFAGNVGIGTTSPGYPLTVNGDVSLQTSSGVGAGNSLHTVNVSAVGYYLNLMSWGGSTAVNSNITLKPANTISNTTGNISIVNITPTYNQASGSGTNTDLLVDRTETVIGSGAQYLIDAGVNTGSHVSKFNVSNTGQGYFAGNVGIGTTAPDATFKVIGSICASATDVACFGTTAGNIYAANFIVNGTTHMPDYVFEADYDLRNISDLENYLNINKHLPNVPSANDISQNGLNLSQMVPAMLEKIEENTLYIIGNYHAIQDLTSSASQQATQISNLLNNQNEDIANITDLQDQLKTSQTQLSTLTDESSVFGLTLTTDEKNIQKLQSDLSDVNDTLDKLQKQISDQGDKATQALIDLQIQVDANAGDIINLKNQMVDLQKQNQAVIDFATALDINSDTSIINFGTWSIDIAGINANSVNLTGDMNAQNVTATDTVKGAVFQMSSDASGEETLKSGGTSVTIETPYADKDAKISITPKGSPAGKTLYVDNVKDGVSFDVRIDEPAADKDIKFYWFIVK